MAGRKISRREALQVAGGGDHAASIDLRNPARRHSCGVVHAARGLAGHRAGVERLGFNRAKARVACPGLESTRFCFRTLHTRCAG